jgi:hypothetical protein
MGKPWKNKLAAGPSSQVTSWQRYDINGYLFYIAAKDKKTVSQNSGVRTEVLDERTGQSLVPVFRCRWVKHPRGVEVDGYGRTIVDLNNIG